MSRTKKFALALMSTLLASVAWPAAAQQSDSITGVVTGSGCSWFSR